MLSDAVYQQVMGLQTAQRVLSVAPNHRRHEDLLRLQAALRNMQWMKDLDIFQRCQLAQVLVAHKVSAGQVIYRQGAPGNACFVVLSGSLRQFSHSDTWPAADESAQMVDSFWGSDLCPTVAECVEKYGPDRGPLADGDSFGEVALVNPSNQRSRTVLAEVDSVLVWAHRVS